jgi:mono/diheme cytochrome c family protein
VFLALSLLAAPLSVAGPAFAQGDVAEGRRIAQRWCASCHVVGPDTRGGDAAPPFLALANDPRKTEDYLRNWIRNPHPPMPNFNLARRDIDDLVAYIRTLRGGGEQPRPPRGRDNY